MSVKDAISAATLAVSADNAKNFVEALRYYGEAVQLIESVMRSASLGERQTLAARATSYKQRIDVLRDFVHQEEEARAREREQAAAAAAAAAEPSDSRLRSSSVFDPPRFPINFVEEGLPPAVVVEAVPESEFHVPFWMMRLIAASVENGGFVTPQLYVPRSAWFQNGVKLAVVTKKVAAFQSVIVSFDHLRQCTVADSGQLNNAISETLKQLTNAQQSLAKHLGYIAQPVNAGRKEALSKIKDFFRGAAQMLTQEHSVDSSEYALRIRDVCQKVQFLEGWLTHYEAFPGTRILASLQSAATWLRTVLCPIVLSDLQVLLQRYLALSAESVYRAL